MSKSPAKSSPKSPHARAAAVLQQRHAGVLLHISSLPSLYGIGDLGQSAYEFVDWLSACGMKYWQVLPLVPAGDGNSPYCSWTSFGGNPAFIDLDDLVKEKLLSPIDPADIPGFEYHRVDFPAADAFKTPLLRAAAAKLAGNPKHRLFEDYQKYCKKQSDWLDDVALFAALRDERKGARWWTWEPAIRDRKLDALAAARKRLAQPMATEKALQFLFDRQWQKLKDYATQKGILLVGDVPIYVGGDSVDVWVNRTLFKLKSDGSAAAVAGCPPDAFSATGQHWGNPVYDWKAHVKTDFAWWRARMERVLSFTDLVRIDHFRGLESYWEIPAGAQDARPGKWVEAPGSALLQSFQKEFGALPFIAEDLGFITPPVLEMRDSFGLPGMGITTFAFGGGAKASELPHNHRPNLVVYPGTHDNETLVGWWHNLGENSRIHARKYLGIFEADARRAADALLRMTLCSVANTAIISLQDLLGLDNSARMNSPGTEGPQNWSWRLSPGALGTHLAVQVKELVELYGRAGS